MSLKTHFISQLKYNQWANELYFEFLNPKIFGKAPIIQEWFSHLTTAQIIWYNRIHQIDAPSQGLFESLEENFLKELNVESNRRWITFLESTDESLLHQVLKYKDTKGQPWETLIKDIVTHVINHGSHHRAQISFQLRLINEKPPAIDYIFFVRSKSF